MDLKVEVTGVGLDDVVDRTYSYPEDEGETVTLGQMVAEALVARITQDPRWEGLAGRLLAAADAHLKEQAPGFVEELVAREVARQLNQPSPNAMVRGSRSTAGAAIVATEVTTQIREKYAPIVDAALMKLSHDLDALRLEALVAFKRGSGR